MVENRCKRFCRTLGAKADAYEAAMQMYDCKASYNKGMIKGRENATNLLTDSLNKEAAKTIYKSYKKGLIDGAEKYRKSLNLMVTDTIKTVTPDSITTALRDSVKMAIKLK